MKLLRRLLLVFTYSLPAVLFFSYYPILKLGQNSTMNFELSLPLLWLVLFDILVIIYLIALGVKTHQKSQKPRKPSQKSRKSARYSRLGFNFPGISDRRIFLLSLFPFFVTLSSLWSANPLRALLTSGIIWLIFLAVFALLYVLPLLNLPNNFPRRLLVSFFVASLLVCIFCWVQSILDIFGVGREGTLLCLGCTYHSFGFPHPSGFAIEPQFMGNLLLAPTLTALYLLVFHHKKQLPISSCRILSERRLLVFFCVVFSSTLFLTFSRGAIYAYVIALVILLIFALRRHRFRIGLILIPALTFIFVVAMQGVFTVIGPTNDSFLGGVSKSLHQLSLGIIDIRPKAQDGVADRQERESSISNADSGSLAETSSEGSSEQPIFEGYVPESTNVRLGLNRVAFTTWTENPTRIFFGVGLGGAGVAMHESNPESVASPKEIVQNQAFSLLLELGLVGVLLVILMLMVLFSPRSGFWSNPALPLFASLLVAYLVTLNFFSGLPNALQIYLLPPLLYLCAKVSRKS